tara:strand:- start:4140 stop:5102 length:963 start_codon:yes stop_codon:yes gene_type:complete
MKNEKDYLYNMNSYLELISFSILSLILAFTVQKIFITYRKFDDFNHRTSHNVLATKTGGISFFISLIIFTLLYYYKGTEIFDFSLMIPLSIMFIVGVYDDFYEADFKLKFLLQIIVSKIIIDQGYVIDSFQGIFGIYELPWIIAQLFTSFVFLIIVNSLNFIDGIDGLAITEVIKVIVIIELISIGNTSIYYLGQLVIFGLTPLYYYNYRKNKKIFLGDAGSLLLGTLISIYIFNIFSSDYIIKNPFNLNKAFFSILLLIYPLTDLLRVFIIRISQKKSPFIADNNHIHHKLLNKKFNHFFSTLIIQIISLILIIIYLFI